MRKTISFIFTFMLLLSLAGCSRQRTAETDTASVDIAPADIAAAIAESQQELPDLVRITSEDAEFATWLSDYYFLQTEQVADGAICYAEGVEASEIAVLLLEDGKNSGVVQTALEEYIQNRAGVFEGYAPKQAALAKSGVVAVNGRYVALLICPDVQKAKEAFGDCFRRKEEESENGLSDNSGIGAGEKAGSDPALEAGESAESVGAEDSYDAEAVLQAWKSGDDSSLSKVNRSILDAAKAVLESEIDDSMSDYEKELAIHDYITGWSSFDYGVFGRSAADGFSDGSDTPYGVLIDRSAMCHGYSATFQLFMDMLDIECLTVFGIPGSNGVEHSWNMVKLDGEWYCVDCAWDDPIGGSAGHTYFNVTSDYLRGGSIHRWDETSVPEATGTAYAYGKH